MTDPADKNQLMRLCPAPALDWSRPGTPASDDFGDIYFSVDGGLEETRAVYLQACGLPARWTAQDAKAVFTVAELGFGTGLNFLATWQAWAAQTERRRSQRLHFISVEKFPLDREALTQALSHWPELARVSGPLIAAWPGRVRGIHRLHFGDVTLTLIHDDVRAGLDAVSFKADAWYLDGFSPARNPDMWSADVMARVGARAAVGARIGTFTAAGFVREGLTAAGFSVSKVDGYGRKRHRIEAVMNTQVKLTDTAAPPVPDNPVIIGAGIAGASLVAAFLRRGIVPTVIDADDNKAASGNPAAIVKPRLDRQDRADSRFFLSSYLYALRAYHAAESVLSTGVFHAAKSEDEVARFKALVAQSPLGAAHMHWDTGPNNTQGIMFPTALTIDPRRAVDALCRGANRVRGRVARIDNLNDGVAVMGEDGAVLARGSHVIFAVGAGVRDFARFDPLGLRFSRGQLTWAQTDMAGTDTGGTITYGGYAIPLADGTLLGATHSRLQDGDIYSPEAVDDAANLSAYAAVMGQAATQIARPSRVSVRVNTAQTWPLRVDCGARVCALTGLGSRGFVFAPLLAEALVSDLCGDPPAIEDGLFHKTV